MDYKTRAEKLLEKFKGEKYLYGRSVLNKVGKLASGSCRKAVLVRDMFPGSGKYIDEIKESLAGAGIVHCC